MLIIVVMDAILPDLQEPVPWTLFNKIELQWQVQAWCNRLERFGLKLNVKKAEYLTTQKDEIKMDGIELPRTSVFKYLGSAIATDGGLLVEANSRMSAA
ncbi:unnamed protein product [Heligmosomoides polygyrus]|uniref:Reverse transcriptase domain-containing protein n=1 Tax=Heligmosomoides polygyrus TaxID=6339 RepID=A0A183G9E4_HELPZ|nr:unnamed protein product [Heligmosomoides polygyrus]